MYKEQISMLLYLKKKFPAIFHSAFLKKFDGISYIPVIQKF